MRLGGLMILEGEKGDDIGCLRILSLDIHTI